MMVFFPPVLFGTPLICSLFMPHFVAKSQRVCFTTVFVVVRFCCYYYWCFFYLFVHLLLQHLGMTTQRSGIVIIMVLATVQLPMMMTMLIGRGFYGSFFRWSMSAAGSSSLRRSSFFIPSSTWPLIRHVW